MQLKIFPTIKTEEKQDKYNALYDAIFKESFHAIKSFAKFTTIEEFRKYLLSTLPQHSSSTKMVNMSKIIDRFFKDGVNANLALAFTKISDESALKEIMFYHYVNREIIVRDFLTDVLYKNIKVKYLPKKVVDAYVTLSLKRDDKKTSQRMITALHKYGMVSRTKTGIVYDYFKPEFLSFVYAIFTELFSDGSRREYPVREIQKSQFRKIFLVSDRVIETYLIKTIDNGFIGFSQKDEEDIIYNKTTLNEILENQV